MLQTWLIDQDRKRSCQASVTQVTNLFHIYFFSHLPFWFSHQFDSSTFDQIFTPSWYFLAEYGWHGLQMTWPFRWHLFNLFNLADWLDWQADTGLNINEIKLWLPLNWHPAWNLFMIYDRISPDLTHMGRVYLKIGHGVGPTQEEVAVRKKDKKVYFFPSIISERSFSHVIFYYMSATPPLVEWSWRSPAPQSTANQPILLGCEVRNRKGTDSQLDPTKTTESNVF